MCIVDKVNILSLSHGMSRAHITPKKRFGQNFLTNPATKKRVCAKIDIYLQLYPGTEIIEIGPGQGDMTEYLISTDRLVTALEIDQEAYEYMSQKYDNTNTLSLVQCDAYIELQNPASQYFSKPVVLFSSLPFNVGSRMLIELSIQFGHVPFCVILQDEVGKKPLPRSEFTLFGAWLAYCYDYTYDMKIPKGAFTPRPKVDCSLSHGVPRLDRSGKRKELFTILKTLFAFPSKTLANNLKAFGWSKEQIQVFILACGFDLNVRLNFENYITIMEGVYAKQTKK
jgi:16S rRNA (adenine1518-N6/adenine1519-N6)-dimethyltransferase